MDWHAIMNHLMGIVQHTGGDQLLSDFYYKNFVAGLSSVFFWHTHSVSPCVQYYATNSYLFTHGILYSTLSYVLSFSGVLGINSFMVDVFYLNLWFAGPCSQVYLPLPLTDCFIVSCLPSKLKTFRSFDH
jgi:hypothetical protein